ncbi:peptidoglycan-binding protein [Actinomadura rudentiformis]|uniref:Peptidoglycan-binding protein n=1 Tax=Actinomadura rudentiformis TaxID=359158 RepID=A0A6H9YDE8_9ACTN|nr:peptidoglycan-binding protein [Actinomadura rudentiformis]
MLTTSLVMRGSFSTGRRFTFTPGSVAATRNGPGANVLVITDLRTREGASVPPGRVLLEVSERPVYALPGRFPAYRDLMPGQTGKDVAQLRSGLARLGYASHDRPGYFGPGTERAVTLFYRALGYPVPVTGGGAGQDSGGGATPRLNAAPSPSSTDRPGPRPTPRPRPMVPRSEVAFLPELPARVVKLSARVGDTVPDELITFTTGGLSLIAKLPPENAGLVKAGMKAEVTAETTGFDGSGTVSSVSGRIRGQREGETPYLPVRIDGDEPWRADLLEEDVRVTITTASSEKAVLAVPEAAITSTADGRTTVTVRTAAQRERLVEVRTGASAGGMVEVSPVGGELGPGDLVVTGR